MSTPASPDLALACGLPAAWQASASWRVLDTDFAHGLDFFSTWALWQGDPQRASTLHYVAFCAAAPTLGDLQNALAAHPTLQQLLNDLSPQWFGLLPGFHRLTLDAGRVLLTLCVGETAALLRQQNFQADSAFVQIDPAVQDNWNLWTVKLFARSCRRGTTLALCTGTDAQRGYFRQCGFEPLVGADDTAALTQQWVFNPRWTLKTTRQTPPQAVQPDRCIVIGAGLAGASVAASLARRGWQVQVIDQAASPAQGASGLPVGLVVPHVSGDDCVLSRLSRTGVRLMQQQARSLLTQGQDWQPCGTLELRVDESLGLPLDWPTQGADWSQVVSKASMTCDTPCADALALTSRPHVPAVWHPTAAWLKPAALVRAWLSQPGVHFKGDACAQTLQPVAGGWAVLDAQGREMARAPRVVLANAGGALPLLAQSQAQAPGLTQALAQLPKVYGTRGQLSWGLQAEAPNDCFPSMPVNGAGSVIPHIPTPEGAAWFVGSSYQPDTSPEWPDAKNHSANLGRLEKLLPPLADVLAPQFASGALRTFKETRCVTDDRLPMVGPLPSGDHPGLWLCAGMGSRGLTFSVLCAELLAAQWGAEPWPLELSLAQSLSAARRASASADTTAA